MNDFTEKQIGDALDSFYSFTAPELLASLIDEQITHQFNKLGVNTLSQAQTKHLMDAGQSHEGYLT